MTFVDKLGGGGLSFFGSEKNSARKGKVRRNGISFFVLSFVAASFVVSSRMGFIFIISLGNDDVGMSMGAKHSLSSFVQESKSDNNEEEESSDQEQHQREFDNLEVWPKPYGWESYGFGLIRKHFGCKAYAHDQTKPLPTLEQWQLFRSRYNEIVDGTATFKDPVPPTMGHTLANGERTPYYAEHSSDGRGRGLFASRDIKEGELVDDGLGVVFPDGMSFRRYIFSLPRNNACDMLDWSWTQRLEDGGDYKVLSDMTISVLCNGGEGSEVNINPESSTSTNFFATRDIKKGEQILMDYKMYKTVWSKADLGDVDREELSSDMTRLSLDEGESYNEPVWPKPRGWESSSIKQISKHFHCQAYARDRVKPLPTLQDWRLFQSKYKEFVDEAHTFDDPVPPTMGYTLNGGPPLFYAKRSPYGRGRGLFASQDIKKGELTHDGTSSNVPFPDAAAWRRFVFSLPRNRACDILDWTWTQKLNEDGEYGIFSALDISVLHNGGRGAGANVNPKSPTSSKFYATRDIKKDEELLTDYLIYDTVWSKVGL